jgi:hypothetical protein
MTSAYGNELERTYVVDQVKDLPFLDKVFRVIHYNNFNRVLGGIPKALPIELNEVCTMDEIEAEDIEEAIARVNHLRSCVIGIWSYYPSDKYYEVKQKFLDDNRGFSSQTYDIAISYDAYVSR